jgi:hypothetical protein
MQTTQTMQTQTIPTMQKKRRSDPVLIGAISFYALVLSCLLGLGLRAESDLGNTESDNPSGEIRPLVPVKFSVE